MVRGNVRLQTGDMFSMAIDTSLSFDEFVDLHQLLLAA
jgi:hypothetical protein